MSEQEVFDALKYRVVVDTRGTRWYYNSANQLHRIDGPAVEYTSGTEHWYQNNQRHRTDGPAVDYQNGGKEWWLNGTYMTEDEFNQRVKLL